MVVVEECFGGEELNKTIVTLPLIKDNMAFLEKGPKNSNLIYHEGSRRGGRWVIDSSS